MQKKLHRYIISPDFLLPLFGILFLLIAFNYDFNIYDEGVGFFGAERLAAGELPYKDFWTMYSPGIYYLYALVMTIFGWTLITGRIVNIIMIFAIALLSKIVINKIKTIPLNWIPFLVITIFYGTVPQSGRAIVPAILLMILSLFFLQNYILNRTNKHLIFAGISTGIIFFFRYDFGVYLFAATLITLLYIKINDRKNESESKLNNKLILWYCSSFLLVISCISLFYIFSVPFYLLESQILDLPFSIFPQYRSIPMPKPIFVAEGNLSLFVKRLVFTLWETISFFSPFVIYLYVIIKLFINKTIAAEYRYLLFLISVFGLFIYGQASVRSDVEHAFPTIFLSFILLVVYYQLKPTRKKIVLISLFFLIFISFPIVKKVQQVTADFSSKVYKMKTSRASGITTDYYWGQQTDQAVDYLRNHTVESDKIFVGSSRHDKIILNNVMFYFLSGRKSCTKYHELHPGVTTTLKVQTEIVSEIEKSKTRYAVLFVESDFIEPNKSSISSGVTILDDYLKSHFTEEAKFGRYVILRSKFF